MARLGDYVRIRTGKLDANASSNNGGYPFFTCAIEPLKIDTYSYDCECVLVAGNGDLNVKYYNGKFDAYQRTYIIESLDKTILSVPYLYYFLDEYVETLRQQAIGGVIKYIKLGNLTEAEIPIRSMLEQERIVANIRKVSDLITLRKEQILKLDQLVKSRFTEMFNTKDFPIVAVEAIAQQVFAGGDKPKDMQVSKDAEHCYPVFANGESNYGLQGFSRTCKVKFPALTVSARGTVGYCCIREAGFTPIVRLVTLVPKDCVSLIYLKEAICFTGVGASGAVQAQLTVPNFKKLQIPLPPMDLQNQFAAFVEQIDKSKVDFALTYKKSVDMLNVLGISLCLSR